MGSVLDRFSAVGTGGGGGGEGRAEQTPGTRGPGFVLGGRRLLPLSSPTGVASGSRPPSVAFVAHGDIFNDEGMVIGTAAAAAAAAADAAAAQEAHAAALAGFTPSEDVGDESTGRTKAAEEDGKRLLFGGLGGSGGGGSGGVSAGGVSGGAGGGSLRAINMTQTFKRLAKAGKRGAGAGGGSGGGSGGSGDREGRQDET